VSGDDDVLDAAELRRRFDESFAAPPAARAADLERLLLLRIAGEGYALALAEVAGLAAGRTITRIPSRIPEVLGLAALRGIIFPVLDLAALLGHGGSGGQPRWLVIVRGLEPLALGFDGFERYLELPRAELHGVASQDPAASRSYVHALARARDQLWAVLDLASLSETVRRKER
jgi:purine-binding chemotaxis protein CheW